MVTLLNLLMWLMNLLMCIMLMNNRELHVVSQHYILPIICLSCNLWTPLFTHMGILTTFSIPDTEPCTDVIMEGTSSLRNCWITLR